MFLLSPTHSSRTQKDYNLDLKLSTSSTTPLNTSISPKEHENRSTQLHLSIGSSNFSEKTDPKDEPLRVAMAEKAFAEDARLQAKRQIEWAEQEFANAKRIRQQAQAELDKAQALREHAMKQINSTILQITCHACKQQFRPKNQVLPPDDMSYISSAVTEGDVENNDDNPTNHHLNSNKP